MSQEHKDIFTLTTERIARERGIELPKEEPQAPKAVQPEEPTFADHVQGAREATGAIPNAIASGMLDAVFNTADFFLGKPADSDKGWLRDLNDRASEEAKEGGVVTSIVHDISQFATGLVGVGKFAGPIKAIQGVKNAGVAGRLAYETGQGAVAGFLALDPHEERLSNLIQQYEPLRNPVTAYLAADEDDSEIEGRLKNALEGIGMDLALAGVFTASLKTIKAMRGGKPEKVAKAVADLQAAEAAKTAEAAKVVPDQAAVEEQALKAVDEAINPKPRNVDDQLEAAVADAITPARSEADAVPLKPQDQRAYSPRVEAEEPDLDAIIKGAREDEAAIKRFGSREAAIQAGYSPARANLPWQKIGSTDDLNALMANTAKVLRDQLDVAKGGDVLSDARVKQMVEDSAELFGEDPEVLMGQLAKSGEAANTMVADMEASYILSRKMLEDAASTATKIRAGLLDQWGGNQEAATAYLLKQFSAAADMMAHGQSMRAAAGRALRRNRAEFAITKEDIELFSNVPPEKLVEVLSSTGGDIRKLAEATRPSFWRRVLDEGSFLFTNNLLWNWTTHAVNTTTNLMMLVGRPTEKLLGSWALGSRGSAVRKQALQEYYYMASSFSDAWDSLAAAFLRGDSVMAPHQTEYFQSGSRVNAPEINWLKAKDVWENLVNGLQAADYAKAAQAGKNAAVSTYRTGVGLPTRGLGAVDEFVKQMRYRGVIQARAAVEAQEAGLKGADFKRHIENQLADAFSPDGRALDDAALREAQITTFQQELLPGTVGKAVQNFRHNLPATTFVLPFVKTPVNVLRYGWKMTPGLNLLQKEYRRMVKGQMGSEAQAHALGQMILGSTFMVVASQLALGGRLTGSGPTDIEVKKQLLATGWQPYSIVQDNPDGTKTYFPIGRFDPVGMTFGMVADLVDMLVLHPEAKENDAAIGSAMMAIGRALSEKSYLMNIHLAVRAASDPENYGPTYLGNLLGNFVPGASGVRTYANQDPYLRDARSFIDRSMAGLPGYSETIPPRRDAFGEPVWRKRGLSTTADNDVVEDEHARIILDTGKGIRPPSPRRGGIDLREVTLSDGRNAYDLMQERAAGLEGRNLKTELAKVIQSENYQKLVDGDPSLRGTKLGALMRVVRQFREGAYMSMLRDYPELRKMIAQAQIDVKAEYDAKNGTGRKRSPSEVEELLKSMGY